MPPSMSDGEDVSTNLTKEQVSDHGKYTLPIKGRDITIC